MEKAIIPRDKIPSVSGVRNWSAASFEPTASPKKIVTIGTQHVPKVTSVSD